MSRKKVTMQQIADAAGVSKFVVSKTLNGHPGVKEATRQKVLFIAKQMGYLKENTGQISHQREDKTKGNGFILVVIPSHEYQKKETSYWSNIVEGITREMENRSLSMVLLTEQQHFTEHIQTDNMQGIIGVGRVSSDMLLKLNRLNVPVVMVDHDEPLLKADYIFMDNISSLYKMTSHLLSLGHRDLVFVGDINHSRSFKDRWFGFRMAMEEVCENFVARKTLISGAYDELERALVDWLEERQKSAESIPTGFVCANDDIAQRTVRVLKEQGWRVPDDCSVTGFDNLESSVYFQPPLASVEVLKEALGRRAVAKLCWRMKNPDYPPEKILVSGDIIVRHSVAEPRKVKKTV